MAKTDFAAVLSNARAIKRPEPTAETQLSPNPEPQPEREVTAPKPEPAVSSPVMFAPPAASQAAVSSPVMFAPPMAKRGRRIEINKSDFEPFSTRMSRRVKDAVTVELVRCKREGKSQNFSDLLDELLRTWLSGRGVKIGD